MLKQELTTTKQKVEAKKDKREGKGRVLAISRRIYRLKILTCSMSSQKAVITYTIS